MFHLLKITQAKNHRLISSFVYYITFSMKQGDHIKLFSVYFDKILIFLVCMNLGIFFSFHFKINQIKSTQSYVVCYKQLRLYPNLFGYEK